MSDAARKMEMLINDLLELSRVGRLNEVKTQFPFTELAEDAIQLLQPRIRENGVQITIGKNLPRVYGERKRLAQVMENLLSNAIKYIGTKNPSPYIEIGAVHQDPEVVFFIRDNGIGIEKTYFEKIFEVFQRLPIAKKFGEGTGVGLAIVKRIIEYHGGRIWLESEPGKGTTFYFTLKSMEAE
jgi:signal transduction histidine kinase